MPVLPDSPKPPTRRTVVAAAGGAGLAAVLTACGSDSGSASGAPAGGGTELGKTSDVPVGGGKIFADQKVVVTQPTAGDFKGFSAVCTHAGCSLTQVSGGTINCLCHGSKFKVADGSVAQGPATAPLETKKVTVSGDTISVA